MPAATTEPGSVHGVDIERERQRAAGYTPPPPTVAPPAGWRPPQVANPPAPRQLPPQHHAEIDAAEESARALTRTVGIITAVVLVFLLMLVCGRLIF
jgi:hypothetical protein